MCDQVAASMTPPRSTRSAKWRRSSSTSRRARTCSGARSPDMPKRRDRHAGGAVAL